MIAKMKKLTFLVYHKEYDAFLKSIRDLGVVHVATKAQGSAEDADLSQPYPGITDVLDTLQRKGMMLAVASNKYQEATSKLIKQYFPQITFAQVFGQREGVPAKPDPSVIFEIIEKTGVKKEEVVYLGDSCVDMQTGINAEVTTIGVSWGFRPRTELEAYHPDFIADRTEDILQYLAE